MLWNQPKFNDCKQYTDNAYYWLFDENKIKIESFFNKLLEDTYFIGLRIDGLPTVSHETQTPIAKRAKSQNRMQIIGTRRGSETYLSKFWEK